MGLGSFEKEKKLKRGRTRQATREEETRNGMGMEWEGSAGPGARQSKGLKRDSHRQEIGSDCG